MQSCCISSRTHCMVEHSSSHEMRKHPCRIALALDAQLTTSSAANAWSCATLFATFAICTALWASFTFLMW